MSIDIHFVRYNLPFHPTKHIHAFLFQFNESNILVLNWLIIQIQLYLEQQIIT